MTTVAVIGAGLSGLVVARGLLPRADVTVFEKSQGPSGRMATRRAGDFEFDHGAQYFSARGEPFRAFLQPLIDAGVVDEWRADLAEIDRGRLTALHEWPGDSPWYVGAPGMNQIGKTLSMDLRIVVGTSVSEINRNSDGWAVTDDAGGVSGPFQWLVLTSPAAQTARLAGAFPELVDFCGTRRMLGCYALMLGFSEYIELGWQAAVVRNADVSWIAVNSSKPGRKSPFTLVVHSSNDWADAHNDDEADQVRDHLLDEATTATGLELRRAVHQQLHRWRYANIDRQTGPAYFLDEHAQLAACGDWCVRGRIEAAFTSADRLAKSLIERL